MPKVMRIFHKETCAICLGKNSDEKSIQNCQALFIFVRLIHELLLWQCKTEINNEFIHSSEREYKIRGLHTECFY